MQDKRKQNNLSINQDDRPSRFMVDLNQLAQERIKEETEQLNFFKILLNRFNQNINKKSGLSETKRDFADFWRQRINRLAFFSAVKIFYNLCYRLGWTTVFAVRFIYILFKRVLELGFAKRKESKKIKSLPAAPDKNFKIAPKLAGSNNNSAPESDSTKPKLSDEIYLDDDQVEAYKEKILAPEQIKEEASALPEEGRGVAQKFDWEDDLAKSLAETRPEKQPDARRLWPKIYRGRLKPAVSFALVLIILILPLKAFTSYKILKDFRGRVLGVSEEAITDLKTASVSAANFNFADAQDNFTAAGDKFKELKNKTGEISSILNILSPLIPSDNIKLAGQAAYIIEAGRQAAIIGSELSSAFSGLGEDEWNTEEFMDILQNHLKKAALAARSLNEQINSFDIRVLPENYQPTLIKLKNLSAIAEKSLLELNDMTLCAKNILGFEKDTRYLFVFENNAELRASGGFIGSYALIDFRSGRIKNMEIPGGGSYDTEGGLREKIISPEPLHLVNPLWHFWDANWWPDWPSSAEKLMWFYEKSGGPTVDGVIAITPTVMERILSIIGPIDMRADYGVVITADNFWETTQEFAETKPALCTEKQVPDGLDGCVSTSSLAKHEPKKIISDLFNRVLEEFPHKLNKENLIKLIAIADDSLKEKHILLYFNDESLEKKISSFGWGGEIRQTAWDYLMVVNTNIAGGKTDRVIKENIDHTSDVAEDGSIINTLKITRVHNGVRGEPFTGIRNVNWMRIYVPLGSELLEAGGFTSPDKSLFEKPDVKWENDPDLIESEDKAAVDIKSGTKIYAEAGKTVFANWSMLDPGKTVVLYLKYKLPFKLDKKTEADNNQNIISDLFSFKEKALVPYAFLAQKQPGSQDVQITSRLELPDNFKINWKYPNNLNTVKNSWYVKNNLNTDRFWAVLLDTTPSK